MGTSVVRVCASLELRPEQAYTYTLLQKTHTPKTKTEQDATPTLVALVTFLVHTLALKRPLTAAAGFAALSLFDLLRFPLVALPGMFFVCIYIERQVTINEQGVEPMFISYLNQHPHASYTHVDMINYVSKALVSFGRIEAFLEREEVEGSQASTTAPTAAATAASSSVDQSSSSPGSAALEIRDGVFRWGGSGAAADGVGGGGGDGQHAAPPTLRGGLGGLLWSCVKTVCDCCFICPSIIIDEHAMHRAPRALGINLAIQPGALTCIYGGTGGGKTSLLAAILGGTQTFA